MKNFFILCTVVSVTSLLFASEIHKGIVSSSEKCQISNTKGIVKSIKWDENEIKELSNIIKSNLVGKKYRTALEGVKKITAVEFDRGIFRIKSKKQSIGSFNMNVATIEYLDGSLEIWTNFVPNFIIMDEKTANVVIDAFNKLKKFY